MSVYFSIFYIDDLEISGLNPQFGGLFRVAVQPASVPQGEGFPDLQVSPGDLLFGSFKTAHLNVSFGAVISIYWTNNSI